MTAVGQASQEEVAERFERAVAAGSERPTGVEENLDDRVNDEENEDLFAEYAPLHFHMGQDHPDSVCETTSLSFAETPRITYHLALPKELLKPPSAVHPYGGSLSNLQLETIVYACQRHETLLPGGDRRCGFFLGDGVGLGKGRQLAGMIAEGWLRGRRKSLWVSVSPDLMQAQHCICRDPCVCLRF